MDILPVWAVFAATLLLVAAAIEAGYRLGRVVRVRSEDEKEAPVSAIAATILALLAFIMAFTFGIVADRYDARKALVREEANAIRTAWARSDFLPEPDRGEAVRLLRAYVDGRLSGVRSYDMARLRAAVLESGRIQRQLWDMAVVNARKDMNSDVAALYVESLNDLASLHASRVNVGLHARLPGGLWLALLALVAVSMLAVGYHTAIARSRRSWIMMMLALSFSLVITLIAALDRPEGGYLPVSQQPLEDVRAAMDAGLEAPPR
jgi:MFS family permease